LFHYYAFDEANGATTWADTGSAGNNLTVGSQGGGITNVAAKKNNGLCENGSTTASVSAAASNTPGSGGVAMSVWLTGNQSAGGFINFVGSTTNLFVGDGGVNPYAISWSIKQSNGTTVTASGSPGPFDHCVGIMADSKIEVYCNGNLVQSQTWDGTFSSGGSTVLIQNNGQDFVVDELAFWKGISFGSSSLRQEFVSALWNGGNGRFYRSGAWA
jgi:hypothetical protein